MSAGVGDGGVGEGGEGERAYEAGRVEGLGRDAVELLRGAKDEEALEEIKAGVLGRKSELWGLLRGLGGISKEHRREAGRALNAAREKAEAAYKEVRGTLRAAALEESARGRVEDVTFPARREGFLRGRQHPLHRAYEEAMEVFGGMGFEAARGPDVETEGLNFTALNIPRWHAARGEHDTLYFPRGAGEEGDEGRVLRTHTSPVQIRALKERGAPLRIVAPGRVYRRDSDKTHTPMFHQVEGLVIEEGAHLGCLKGTVEEFLRLFFEREKVELRFRPGYFPFTEPSVEVDVRYKEEGGRLLLGEGEGWLEILGSGMVHPSVLRGCGLDPEDSYGFAFGMGLDRLAMLKYGLTDLRSFFTGDLRWLEAHGFSPLGAPSVHGGLGG